MIIAGLLSTMNVFVDKIDDIRVNLNDLYMSLLMTGFMFLLTGIYNKSIKLLTIGGFIVLISFYFIRKQIFIFKFEYLHP